MADIPTGSVTFLFSDVKGSTKLAQLYLDKLPVMLKRHNEIMQESLESHGGLVFRIVGDAFCCAFEKAADAVRAAVAAQMMLNSEKWDEAVISVRMGIHSGTAEWNGRDYVGQLTLARAEKVMSTADGGQILISKDAYEKITASEFDELLSSANGEISFMDLGERRLKDLIQPVRIYQITAAGLRSEFPQLNTLDVRPNNLPVQISNFIGREQDIKFIRESLRKSSIVTITGTGGSGKTRLALQTAAELCDEFTAGVWLIELAQLNGADLIQQSILQTFNLKEQAGQNPEDILLAFLKEKEILLIFDTGEHVIDASAKFAEKLLRNCSKLKIISTSREALKIGGEVVHKLASLTTPVPEKENTLEAISQFEAVKLFIDRALTVDANFQVDNDNAPALAEICHRLDGIPLAIELAAARVRILTLQKINERLSDRFKLLTGGKRTVLPRQQTLRAMIDWSYDLLNDTEKLLFHRLSVFSGGWTIESAEEICSDEIIESYDVIDILTGLLEKSLVTTKEDSNVIRFSMLESIRQYAIEKAGNEEEINQRHLNYFKKLVDSTKMRFGNEDMLKWIRKLDAEMGNIRKAIQWGMEHDTESAHEITNFLTEYWQAKGFFREGYQTCKKLLELDENAEPIHKANALHNISTMLYSLANLAESEKYADEALAIFREIDDRKGIVNCLNILGVVSNMNSERSEEAFGHLNKALNISRELNIKETLANTLYNLSYTSKIKNEIEKLKEYRYESLSLYRELGHSNKVALILASLGILERNRKNSEKARNLPKKVCQYSERLETSILNQ
ncbi:MAG: tetratricopeptide repeat protein [Ignavibacteria bacterium]|nr:tetratricopeptide repeat protein [Ignavibacteria bacterium]